MFYRNVLALLIFLVLGLAAATPTRADVIQLFSPADLVGGTTLDFPNVTPGFVGTVFNGPVVARGGVVTATFTAAGGQLVRFDQGVGFFGSFANGTELVVTERATGATGTPTGPLTITFNIPIFGFGISAQNTFTEADETSTFTFSVFDGATLLGTFSRSGPDFVGPFQTDPLFLGVRAILGQQITRIVISGASTILDSDGDGIPDSRAQNNFAVGPPTVVVPEPATMILLGTGLAGIAAARRRRRQQQQDGTE